MSLLTLRIFVSAGFYSALLVSFGVYLAPLLPHVGELGTRTLLALAGAWGILIWIGWLLWKIILMEVRRERLPSVS